MYCNSEDSFAFLKKRIYKLRFTKGKTLCNDTNVWQINKTEQNKLWKNMEIINWEIKAGRLFGAVCFVLPYCLKLVLQKILNVYGSKRNSVCEIDVVN